MTSLFGITSADIQAKLLPNPGSSSDVSFLIGDSNTASLSNSACLAIVEAQESKVLANLDDRYRRLLTKVEEKLTRYAAQGETVFQTSFYPISNLKVYVNFGDPARWEARRPDDITTLAYTANTTTGALTFSSGLNAGDTVYVEYNHTGASRIKYLKDIAESLTAIEIANRFPYFRNNAERAERFTIWAEQVNQNDLKKLRFKDIGVPELDAIQMIWDDTDSDPYSYLLKR